MNDLLLDVKPVDQSNRPSRTTANPAFGRAGDVEMGAFAPPPSEQEASLQGFLATVEDIKKEMAQIKSYQLEIVNMHEKSKTLIKTADVKRSKLEMQEKISVISGVATKIKKRVEALDKDNEAARKLPGQGAGSATERTRTTVTAGLKKKLKDQMAEFTSLRNRIQDEYREIVERRVYAVTGKHVPEEEIDGMIESGEAESIFQTALTVDQAGRGRVLDTLAEIEERHRAVKDLEQSLLELHQIFLDMAVLVETQGEQLDNIQKQVESGAAYVATGAVALEGAKNYQKKSRKLMCWGSIIVIIIIIIIILAVVRPWRFVPSNN